MERSRKLLVSALLAGCVALLAAYKWTGGGQKGTVQATAPLMVSVVVAKEEIPAGIALNANLVEVKQVQPLTKMEGAFSTPSDLEGRYTKDRVLKGEQLVSGRLLEKGQAYALPVNIPPGKRAVSIACNEVIGVAGFIKPGDFVDVLGTFDKDTMGKPITVTVLEGVQILAISQEMAKEEEAPAKVSTSATLAVTLEQAQKLTLAEEKGRLRLVLRPPESGNKVLSAGNTSVTPEELVPKAQALSLSKDKGRARVVTVRPSKVIKVRTQPTTVSARQSSRDMTANIVKVEVIRGVARETLELPAQP